MSKIIKAGFSKTFPTGQYFEKIFLEAEIIEGDNVRNVLYDLKKQIEQFHYESNKAAEKQKEVIKEEEKLTLTSVADLIKEINFCKTVKHLEDYKYAVQKDIDLQAAYDKKLKSLQ